MMTMAMTMMMTMMMTKMMTMATQVLRHVELFSPEEQTTVDFSRCPAIQGAVQVNLTEIPVNNVHPRISEEVPKSS